MAIIGAGPGGTLMAYLLAEQHGKSGAQTSLVLNNLNQRFLLTFSQTPVYPGRFASLIPCHPRSGPTTMVFGRWGSNSEGMTALKDGEWFERLGKM